MVDVVNESVNVVTATTQRRSNNATDGRWSCFGHAMGSARNNSVDDECLEAVQPVELEGQVRLGPADPALAAAAGGGGGATAGTVFFPVLRRRRVASAGGACGAAAGTRHACADPRGAGEVHGRADEGHGQELLHVYVGWEEFDVDGRLGAGFEIYMFAWLRDGGACLIRRCGLR